MRYRVEIAETETRHCLVEADWPEGAIRKAQDVIAENPYTFQVTRQTTVTAKEAVDA